MPRDPNEAYQSTVDVDDEKKWRGKLRTVVEMESKFTDRRKNSVYLSWHFTLHDMDTGVPVIDDATGDPFELWAASNDATFYNADTGKIGGAREMANCLLARDVTDEEIQQWNADGIEGWNDALAGRTAIFDVEWTETPEGYRRLKLLRKRPDTAKKAAQAAGAARQAPPPPEPGPMERGQVEVPETPQERRARLVKELEGLGE